MEKSGRDLLSDSERHAPVSPLHLAVSLSFCQYVCVCLDVFTSHTKCHPLLVQ